MEMKTKLSAENGKQEITITREFDLPLELLFRAYSEPELLAQWMGTNVLKLENRKYGGYIFETTDDRGKVVFRAHGVYHEFSPDKRIIRTFEMEHAPFTVQLEFLEFEKLDETTSRLSMHIVFRSVAYRDKQLQLPFARGLNMAHDRLQEIAGKLK